ncbi:lanthionine synthetase LanC family protein [Algoriphagus terrigena]|uniref:lanthionine synthetase LanC family protein n=1 Tax=Algoriphagus terrigena TaxID=344884 RepID=UPI0003FDB5CD|nr:lanthionine synthetase LanC family protein [Algoriphagus terrigena]
MRIPVPPIRATIHAGEPILPILEVPTDRLALAKLFEHYAQIDHQKWLTYYQPLFFHYPSPMFLDEAIQLGDRLLGKAKEDENGMFWMTVSSDLSNKEFQSFTIYNGACGFALLFLELYRVTKREKYRIAVEKALSWSIHEVRKDSGNNFAFYTGKMSVVFTLIKANEMLSKKEYLDEALSISRGARSFVDFGISDLLNGTSGTLLVLIHLYAATQDLSVLSDIEVFAKTLLRRANLSRQGIYWDRMNINIAGLCGLSHGASGVALAFLELGAYFGNDAIISVARLAMEYEEQFYELERKNWSDLRTLIHIDEFYNEYRNAYDKGLHIKFEETKFVLGWCHGAPGIGLVRLRAYQLLKDERYLEQVIKVIDTVQDSLFDRSLCNNFSLCHGVMGNAQLLLAVAAIKEEPEYRDAVLRASAHVIEEKVRRGYYLSGMSNWQEDDSLLLGNAGIAYSFLLISEPKYENSILLPEVARYAKTDSQCIDLPNWYVKEQIIRLRFPRSLNIISKVFPDKAKNYFSQKVDLGLAEDWKHWAHSLAQDNSQVAPFLTDVIDFETFVFNLDLSTKSNAYLYFKSEIVRNEASELLQMKEEEFLGRHVEKCTDIVIRELKWNLKPLLDQNYSSHHSLEGECTVVLIPRFWGVEEQLIESDLLLEVLRVFSTPKKISQGILEIVTSFEDIDSQIQMYEVEHIICAQVKEALVKGLLAPSPLSNIKK